MTAGSPKAYSTRTSWSRVTFWKGPPYRCMLVVEAGLAALILIGPILTEFAEKLTGRFGVPKSEADAIVERWTTRAEMARIEGMSGWDRRIPMTISSLRRHSSAAPQSSCLETVTCSRWASSDESKS
jgi:hypothetical protein